MTDQLGSERPFIGPESACGISMGVAKKVVKEQTMRDHRTHWDRKRHSYNVPSASKTRELLKLNRNQLRWLIGLLTGHSPERAPFQTGINK
jgi:hypothetical protein